MGLTQKSKFAAFGCPKLNQLLDWCRTTSAGKTVIITDVQQNPTVQLQHHHHQHPHKLHPNYTFSTSRNVHRRHFTVLARYDSRSPLQT